MAEVSDLLQKARDIRTMADAAGSETESYRLRRRAYELEREAEAALRRSEPPPDGKR